MLTVRVLGSVEVARDGVTLPLSSAKQRLLLAVLAAHGSVVSRTRLVDALWPEDPPSTAVNTLMGYVSRLRHLLGAEAIVSRGSGYLLRVDDVDAREFEQLVQRGDRRSLETALALWRGSAYGDLGDHPTLVGEARRLDELRTYARMDLAAELLDVGAAARPVSMLEALVGDEPLREDAWVLLVRALVGTERYADARNAAARCRRALADAGLTPTAALQHAERAAFAQRGSPGAPSAQAAPDVGPVRYARNGGTHLACQVVGGGPVDLVLSSYGSVSIDSIWDSPEFTSYVSRLGRRCRAVLYDTRGIGLSDPIDVDFPPNLDTQAEDLLRVIQETGAERAVVVGVGEGGPTAVTLAARRPPQLTGLVLVNTFARVIEAPDYPGISRELFESYLQMSTDPSDGRDTSLVLRNHAPSVAGDAAFRRWWERSGRRGASPATAASLWRVRYGADVRPLLPEIDVPTLVLHRRDTRVVPLPHGRYLAEHVPGARLVELEGEDQPPFTGGADELADQVVEFALSTVAQTKHPRGGRGGDLPRETGAPLDRQVHRL